ncbi:MAG: hypothetical protein ABIK37_07390 [candidate division WOR-3 bacterium]
MRSRSSSSRSRYWRFVVVLAVLGTLFVALWPRPGVRVLRALPAGPRPEYRVRELRDLPSGRVDRVSVVAVVRPGFENDSLRNVLDWLLYSTLEQCNRRNRRRVQVVWAYLVEHETTATAHWRAMAIWHDPSLPESRQPAGPGGDVVRVGSVQYDFTNPIESKARE